MKANLEDFVTAFCFTMVAIVLYALTARLIF